MKDLGFTLISEEKHTSSVTLTALGTDDTKITITLEMVSENLTCVRIHIGIFGDESLSRLTLERIKNHLGR